MNCPSIFNDVLGPVMRGPSSSHSAASVRIGLLARDLMDGVFQEAVFTFDPDGSLAATYHSQGADMGLYGGLLGLDPADEGLLSAGKTLKDNGCRVTFKIEPFPAPHPNTYWIDLKNDRESLCMVAISTGGGMIEILEIDGFPVDMKGDYCESLIWTRPGRAGEVLEKFGAALAHADQVITNDKDDRSLIQVKAGRFMDDDAWRALAAHPAVLRARQLRPVLPVLSRRDLEVPFLTPEEMLKARPGAAKFWELAVEYEAQRGGVSADEILEKMRRLLALMRKSLAGGLEGTTHQDRMLGPQSLKYGSMLAEDKLLEGRLLNRMLWYTAALMEVKSSLGVFVAAPTAGSCAALPAACLAMGDHYGHDDERLVKALLSAGLVGVFIASGSTFAAEVCGCQAECGSASGMITAALLTLMDADVAAHLAGVSLALQNIFGLTCDPVAERVEVPCLGKNVLAVSNAWSAANLALAGFDPVVPLGEVITAMDEVGRSLPASLRCTGKGGLSITPTARKISRQLS